MSDNKYKFQTLTPVRDADLSIYEDAIDFIFTNKDIKNVAISGPYSAGKSSILESYKEKNPKKRFKHISLAHFESPKKITKEQMHGDIEHDAHDDEQAKITSVKESILEGKIINQLIHQISPDKIPQTNFKVKREIESWSILMDSALVVLFLMGIIHITCFRVWNSYISSLPDTLAKSVFLITINSISTLVSGIFCLLILSRFIYCIVWAHKNKNFFRKISFQGNEIEVFEKNEDSFFDKYLNEVLYLFKHAESDVIVFEDMDRFNVNRIFERLREINALINIQLEKEEEPVRFFYLLRDDIFISKDRTKFFDYIIPVVPVVDSSNSYDQFISLFKTAGIFEKFNESFLQGLSLYIDDMRILKNIYNEFIVYHNRLNITELNCDKMLAIITYKNLFPKDFSDLHLNKGFVCTLFNAKLNIVQEEITSNKAEIRDLHEKIKLIKKEHLENTKEVDIVYAPRLSGLKDRYDSTREAVALREEIKKRKEAISARENDEISKITTKITEGEERIRLLRDAPMHEIITRENIDTAFKITSTNEINVEILFSEIKGSDYFDLLKYLIRNGYIDETYADYMTYFYENSLNRIEKIFLRSIVDRKAKEYTYQLQNPKMAVDRLRLADFDQEETLNFDLLEYLLINPAHGLFLDRFLQQLKKTSNYKFIGAYFDTQREIAAYVVNLNIQWPEFFYFMIKEKTLSAAQKRQYSISTLYYSNDESILAVNIDNCLSGFISQSDDYLDIDTPRVEKLIHGFSLINVLFVEISYNISDRKLFNAVYEKSLYELNYRNLSLMLQEVYHVANNDDLCHKNYTLVMSRPETPLACYVNNNINEYLGLTLSKCEGNITDNEEIVLLILNNDDVAGGIKINYIEFLNTKIMILGEINDRSLWELLLDKRLITYSVENIFSYFNHSALLDSTLIGFINDSSETLDFSDAKESLGDEKAKELFDAVVTCNALSIEKYKEIIGSFNYYYDVFDMENIDDEKMRIIIDLEIARISLDTILFIRENYRNQKIYYIKKNLEQYVSLMTSAALDLDEVLEILSWDVNDAIKIPLLKLTSQQVSINRTYSPTVNAWILEHNLNADDLPNLFENYHEWDSALQVIILRLARTNLENNIIANPRNVSIELLKTLLSSDSLDNRGKLKLFASSFPVWDKNECIGYLNMLGLTEFIKIYEPGRRPSFEINENNAELLIAFKDVGLLLDFQRDQSKPGYYKITRQRQARATRA